MAQQDFRDVLRMYKENNCEEELNIDAMKSLESLNPKLSLDSKSYREGNKYIFKQPISYENAEDIMQILSSAKEYDEYNISLFKDEIRKKCSLITTLGESPTEMLIYGTKLLGDSELYINCILDELKNLKESDQYFLEAYKNILNNWNWSKQLEICIKSISSMYLKDLSTEVYKVFETNAALRKDAAIALIDLESKEHYKGIINLLIALMKDTESREFKGIAREVFYYLGKKDVEGSTYLYAHNLKSDYLKNEVRNIMSVGIKQNVTPGILKDIEKRLKDKSLEGYDQTKLIRLLGRLKGRNEACKDILLSIKNLNHINKTEVTNALGDEDDDLELVIKDEHAPLKQRVSAIINLGKSENENAENVLRNIASDNKVLKVAVHSALFEKGYEKEVIPIFGYAIDTNSKELEQEEAKNQIKRLRGLKNEELSKTLFKVVKTLLADDKNKTRVLTILDLYSTGIAEEPIGEVFLEKLKHTDIVEAKMKIMDFFNRNICTFNKNLQKQIREEFVNRSREDNNVVKEKALQCLKEINIGSDLIPD